MVVVLSLLPQFLQMIQLSRTSEFKYWFLWLIVDTVETFTRSRTFVLESKRPHENPKASKGAKDALEGVVVPISCLLKKRKRICKVLY